MNRSLKYLKKNHAIVEELYKRGIIGKHLKDSANASFYISKRNPDNLVKVFNCYNSNNSIIIERKNDFINEIEILKCLQKTLKDRVSQIIDSGYFKINNGFAVYYEMPKYEIYNKNKNKNAASILNDFKNLFKVLERIHSLGYIHFDIKPANIMAYMDRPVIIDFGCAQKESGKIKLPKGPKWFKPPELLDRSTSDENLQNCIDYKKSDIYMMSKTLWAVLQNGMYEKGFYGDYNRNYLLGINDKLKVNCEPLNLLFENTIITDWVQRLSIKECVMLLDNQIDILNDEYYESGIGNKQYVNYNLLEQLHVEKPSILVFEDGVSIEKIVKRIKEIKIYKKKIDRISDRIKILDMKGSDIEKELLKPVSENHYTLKYKNKIINVIINRINVYESSENQSTIEIKLADVNEFKDKYTLLPQFSVLENDVTSGTYYLDSNYEIIVELDSNIEKLSINSLFE